MPKPRIARLVLDPDTRRREKEALRQTLETRQLVDRAKGLLMAKHGLSESDAFRRIRKTSMDTRTPMAEVARGLALALAAQHQASRA